MASLGDLMIRVGADLSSFNAAMGSMSDRLKTAEREATSSWSGFEALGSRLTSVGATLSAAVTAPIIGIGAASASAFAGFESSMNKVSALGEITGKDLDKLKAQAIDLGAKTQFSAKQAADGMAELAAAGFKTTEVMQAMPAVLNLAAAGSMSVAQASETAVNVMGGFGIKAADVGHAVDVMAKAAASGSLGVSDLGLSFKYIGPVAVAAGVSFEETAAAVTLLSNAGIKGEQAGTTLRQALSRLIDPPKAAAEALTRLGVETEGTGGKMRPFGDILADLARKGATTKDVFAIFGDTAASGMQALLNTGAPALRTMTAELQKSDGAAEKMAGTLNSGLTGAWEKAKGSIETAGITMGTALAPALIQIAGLIESGANKIAEFAKWFGELPTPVQNTALAFTAVVAAAGPLLLIAGQIATAITSIHAALALATPLLATFTTTVGASVATFAPWVVAIGAATVAVYKLWEAWDGWKSAKKDLEDVETTGADALNKLENRLRDNGYAVDKLKKSYQDGKVSLTQYQAELRKMGVELGNKQKATTAAATATTKATQAEKDIAAALAKVSSAAKDHSAALKSTAGTLDETATASGTLHKRSEILFEISRQLEEQHKKNIRELVAWKLAHQDAASVIPQLIQPTQELTDRINALGLAMQGQASKAPIYHDALAEALKIPPPDAAPVEDSMNRAGNSIDGLRTRARTIWGGFNTDLGGSLGRATTIWDDWAGNMNRGAGDLASSLSRSIWDGPGAFGTRGLESLKRLGMSFVEDFAERIIKVGTDLLSGILSDLIGGKGFGGIVDSVKNAGRAIADVFGGGGASAAAGAGGSIPTGGGGSIPTGGGGGAGAGGSAAGGIGGVAGAVNLASGLVGAVSSVIGNFQNAHQETSLNAIEHNTRFSMMYLGERSDGGILGQMFRVADLLEYGLIVKVGEDIRNYVVDHLPGMYENLSDINARMQFAVTRLDQIGHNALYGSEADTTNTRLLAEIRDSLRARTGGGQITVNVSGAANPQATGDEIMRQLRLQGAFA